MARHWQGQNTTRTVDSGKRKRKAVNRGLPPPMGLWSDAVLMQNLTGVGAQHACPCEPGSGSRKSLGSFVAGLRGTRTRGRVNRVRAQSVVLRMRKLGRSSRKDAGRGSNTCTVEQAVRCDDK